LLKIRLRRTGAKKKPTYRVVVAESTSPRDGRYVEVLGTYNPLTDPSTFNVDAEKTLDWIRKGAQPTERVARMLAKSGIGKAEGDEPRA
jgi:small subunit ribosomal protein S16